MILQRLSDFANSIPDNVPSMYSELAFKWQIELDEDGTYQGITPLSDGTKKDYGRRLIVPSIKKTSGVKASLLAENAKYALGMGVADPSESPHFTAFCDLIGDCDKETREITVHAVSIFLDRYKNDPALRQQLLEDQPEGRLIEAKDNMIFRVGSTRPVDLQSVRRFWARYNSAESDNVMQCIVCGNEGPVDRISPIPIKGIPGGQSTGMALVSGNKDAFLSYGLKQANIAPTCRACGEAYANAINYMIRSDQHHVRVGPMMFLFWTAGGEYVDVSLLLSQPTTDQVKELIISYRKGVEQHGVDVSAFYALSLSASGGRVVVRDWLETTVPTVHANLKRWFDLQRIVDPYGAVGHLFGVYGLAASLYLKPNDQMVAEIPRSLVNCALFGGKLPENVLFQAVSRNRAEQAVTSNRAALIKAVILSQMENYEEDYMQKLEEKCTSPAYLCGRLLAVIEAAQKLTINPKATLVDRFYGSASSAPATVFGNLLRDLQTAYMSKLRKEKPGIYFALDNQVQDILANLQEFPTTLDARGQAMFALGYYHQKADNRAQAKAKAELKALASQEEANNEN